jgi:hypothetical protein
MGGDNFRRKTRKVKRPSRKAQKGGMAPPTDTVIGGAVRRPRVKQPEPGPSQCHPCMGKVTPAHGCLPIELLRRIAKQKRIRGAENMSGEALRKALDLALGVTVAGAERTFLEALPISEAEKADLAKRHLRPKYPDKWRSDPDMWLDTNNIADVMNQYEECYPHFEFMGPFPIDFAAPDPYVKGGGGAVTKKCLMNEICELRVQKALKSGTKAVGIVYNLDPHFKSGSHWVANYIDIPGHQCYYFDSYGMAPPPQVAKFMKWLTTQDPKMKLQYNSRRLQYNDTECGIYCCYFIIRMLEGDKFLDITRRKPRDGDMLDLRDWLFST